jgi:hypothetical protein
VDVGTATGSKTNHNDIIRIASTVHPPEHRRRAGRTNSSIPEKMRRKLMLRRKLAAAARPVGILTAILGTIAVAARAFCKRRRCSLGTLSWRLIAAWMIVFAIDPAIAQTPNVSNTEEIDRYCRRQAAGDYRRLKICLSYFQNRLSPTV